MKKRWWVWFLVWTLPFFLLTAIYSPYLAIGLLTFFGLYALHAWHALGYTRDWHKYKERLKDPQPLAEVALFGVVGLMFFLAILNQPDETLIVLIALIPLLAGLAFPSGPATMKSK